jgi:hypothetical protein
LRKPLQGEPIRPKAALNSLLGEEKTDMPTETAETKAPARLDTIFLTGPGGLVYEIPRDVAAKHVVGPARIKELGHLPIEPYSEKHAEQRHSHGPSGIPADIAGGDVEGRHLVPNQWGQLVWHYNPIFGTARGVDGYFYTGVHTHPYGTEIAVFL